MRTTALYHVPLSALSADSKIHQLKCKIDETPEGGKLLGVLEPIWMKVTESEVRIAWLSEMLDRKLVAKDIEIFGNRALFSMLEALGQSPCGRPLVKPYT